MTTTENTEALAEVLHRTWCNSTHHRAPFCRNSVATNDGDRAAAVLASDWLEAYVAAERAVAWEKGFAEGAIAQAGLDALSNPYRPPVPTEEDREGSR